MYSEMPHLSLPIVLAHGIFMRDDSRRAWGRIPLWLSEGGNAVFFAGTDACAPVERNARILADAIESVCVKHGTEAVHLIGFSRGGIDAWYCATHSAPDGHIASITTICTPHTGSFVAGNGFAALPRPAVQAVSSAAEWRARILGDTRPEAYRVFRELDPTSIVAASKVDGISPLEASPYRQSFALASARPCRRCFLRRVCEEDIPNDGLVSVRSATWGHFQGTFHPAGFVAIDAKHEDMVDRRRRNIRLSIRRPDGTTHDVGDLRNAWCLMLSDLKEAFA